MMLPPVTRTPYRVSMVCLGNICRSPMAATVLAARLASSELDGLVEVDSAGTGSWHIGEPADPRARAALAGRGYDAAGHRARQVDRSWFTDYDLLLAMDHDNLSSLRQLAPDPGAAARVVLLRSFDSTANGPEDRTVPDPYFGDDRGFDASLDIIERSVDGLLDALRAHVAA